MTSRRSRRAPRRAARSSTACCGSSSRNPDVLQARLRLESRNLNDITAQYPELRPLGRALSSHTAVLDGEIVAFDENGRPSFGRLQHRMHVSSDSAAKRLAKTNPVVYVVFDLLWLDGRQTIGLSLEERRERDVQTIHSREATLADVFIRVTGRALL